MIPPWLAKSGLEDVSALGSAPAYLLVALLFLALGDAELALLLLAGLACAYVAVVAIRLVHFKDRPRKQSYGGLLGRIENASFPSMHACRAALLATLVWWLYPWWEMAALLWGVALAVIATRVLLRKHDIWDVLAGALLGVGIGAALLLLA